MTRRGRRPGFTLAELLVAVTLFGIMMAGMAGFYAMVFRSQTRRFTDVALQNGGTLVRRAFDSAVGAATYVQDPSTGCIAGYLTAWTNLDADGATPLVAGVAVRFQHLCVDKAQQQVFLYQGRFPKPAFLCGEPAPRGASRVLVAGGPGFHVDLSFYRPEENLVQMNKCLLTLTGSLGEAHEAGVQAQAVIRHAYD